MLNIIKRSRFFGSTQRDTLRDTQHSAAAQHIAHPTTASITSPAATVTPHEEDLSALTPEQLEYKLQLRAMYARMAERQAIVEAEVSAQRLWR